MVRPALFHAKRKVVPSLRFRFTPSTVNAIVRQLNPAGVSQVAHNLGQPFALLRFPPLRDGRSSVNLG
jgi:hypothetical protein